MANGKLAIKNSLYELIIEGKKIVEIEQDDYCNSINRQTDMANGILFL